MLSGSTCNCDQHKLGWKVLVAAEVRAKKKGSQGRRLWGGGRLFMELDFWGGQIIILSVMNVASQGLVVGHRRHFWLWYGVSMNG